MPSALLLGWMTVGDAQGPCAILTFYASFVLVSAQAFLEILGIFCTREQVGLDCHRYRAGARNRSLHHDRSIFPFRFRHRIWFCPLGDNIPRTL